MCVRERGVCVRCEGHGGHFTNLNQNTTVTSTRPLISAMSWRRRSRERASPSNSDAHSCSRSRILRLMRALHLPIRSSSTHRQSYSYLRFRGQKKGGVSKRCRYPAHISSGQRQWGETVGTGTYPKSSRSSSDVLPYSCTSVGMSEC